MALSGLLIQSIGAQNTAVALGAWVTLVAGATTLYGPLRRSPLAEPLTHDHGHSVTERVRVCSFCSKTDPEVRWMICGKSGVIICNECVSRCNGLITEANGTPA